MDILSHINLLCFDIKEKVFDELDILKQTDYNKRNLYNSVINELNFHIKQSKYVRICDRITFIHYLYRENLLKCVYKDMSIGIKSFDTGLDYITTTTEYDENYYNDLDFLVDCDINTEIDIDDMDISQHYQLKKEREYKYIKNYELHNFNEDDDEYFGLIKRCRYCIGFHLWDWLEEVEYTDTLYDILDTDFENIDRDNDILKKILYKTINGYSVFYKQINL